MFEPSGCYSLELPYRDDRELFLKRGAGVEALAPSELSAQEREEHQGGRGEPMNAPRGCTGDDASVIVQLRPAVSCGVRGLASLSCTWRPKRSSAQLVVDLGNSGEVRNESPALRLVERLQQTLLDTNDPGVDGLEQPSACLGYEEILDPAVFAVVLTRQQAGVFQPRDEFPAVVRLNAARPASVIWSTPS